MPTQCNPYQNTNGILNRTRTNNPKMYMEPQKTQKVKVMLRKQKNAENITRSGFKLYYKAIVIKTAWQWHKNIHRSREQNREPRNKPLNCQLIQGKGNNNIQSAKDNIFNK